MSDDTITDPDVGELLARLDVLEQWAAERDARSRAVALAASPPITIGPFTNVPAPGSPIRSDWPQQITNFVNDRFPNSMRMLTGMGTYPTNANGDALIGLSPAFGSVLISALVVDASQGFDVPFIIKVMNAASSVNTVIARVYNRDGTKVVSNASIVLAWLAFGR